MVDDSHRWLARVEKAREKIERDLVSILGRVGDLADRRAELLAVSEYVDPVCAARTDGDYERLLRRGLRRPEPMSDLRFGNGEPMPVALLIEPLVRWAGSPAAADVEIATVT
jgi:hypothetical protein